MKLELKQVKLNEVISNPINAKIHDADQIEQIKKSIEEFGFNDPIAIDKNGTIIEGHGRYIAAQELGFDQIPTIILQDLNDQQKEAYALVHNKLTMNTGFDLDLLQDELESIKDFDMSEYSFVVDISDYFDQTQESQQVNKVIVTVSKDKAENLRTFLNENNYKYKEKTC